MKTTNKDRFFFRFYDTVNKEYTDARGKAIACEVDAFMLNVSTADHIIIEQATGFNDRDGTPLFENDLVMATSVRAADEEYVIVWSDMDCGWVLQSTKSLMCKAINGFTGDDLRLCGNIHEKDWGSKKPVK